MGRLVVPVLYAVWQQIDSCNSSRLFIIIIVTGLTQQCQACIMNARESRLSSAISIIVSFLRSVLPFAVLIVALLVRHCDTVLLLSAIAAGDCCWFP